MTVPHLLAPRTAIIWNKGKRSIHTVNSIKELDRTYTAGRNTSDIEGKVVANMPRCNTIFGDLDLIFFQNLYTQRPRELFPGLYDLVAKDLCTQLLADLRDGQSYRAKANDQNPVVSIRPHFHDGRVGCSATKPVQETSEKKNEKTILTIRKRP